MPIDNLHSEYLDARAKWVRMRDILGGADSVKRAGELYLPKLGKQTEDEYEAYKLRACFYNAVGRTHESLLGLVFRTAGTLLRPRTGAASVALDTFLADVDLSGSTFPNFARRLVGELLAVGRVGALVDWEGASNGRALAVLYRAEDILNWREERIDGERVLTMAVLRERAPARVEAGADPYETGTVEQLRVLTLEVSGGVRGYAVTVWQWKGAKAPVADGSRPAGEWVQVDRREPKRAGLRLPFIPFWVAGAEGRGLAVGPVPLDRLAEVNLDHYRLDADYKHALHYTALPTAYITGTDLKTELEIGSKAAWILENKDARVGYLEFNGQGLGAFERALDACERKMAVLGTRMLESQKRAYESAQTIELRQTAEHCSLGALALSASECLSDVLRWVCWWSVRGVELADFGREVVRFDLTQDYTPLLMTGDAVNALVNAWEKGAISQDTLLDALRRGEILQEARTNAEEKALADAESRAAAEKQKRTN